MILLTQALAEYVGITGSRLGQALGQQAERASRFVGDHQILVIVGIVGIIVLIFGRRRRRF
jgi:hypothetical protein